MKVNNGSCLARLCNNLDMPKSAEFFADVHEGFRGRPFAKFGSALTLGVAAGCTLIAGGCAVDFSMIVQLNIPAPLHRILGDVFCAVGFLAALGIVADFEPIGNITNARNIGRQRRADLSY